MTLSSAGSNVALAVVDENKEHIVQRLSSVGEFVRNAFAKPETLGGKPRSPNQGKRPAGTPVGSPAAAKQPRRVEPISPTSFFARTRSFFGSPKYDACRGTGKTSAAS